MKILIAYDGSQSAKDAIQDLKYAGLPESGVEAMVLAVGEVRVANDEAINLDAVLPLATYAVEHVQDVLAYALDAAERDAEDGKKIVAELFPQWDVLPIARLSSPATTILEVAEANNPDLIVMGSHGRGTLGRLFLGSVSLRVANEAQPSVRITRRVVPPTNPSSPMVLLAFDGSRSSSQAVHKLLKRPWPTETRLHIVSAIDIRVIAAPEYVWLVGSDLGMYQEMKESRIEHALRALEGEMKKHFHHVTTAMPVGNPANEILTEARRVHADTIFMGSRGLSGFERMLLGSVAHSVAVHAEQTVEIVRTP